MTARSLASFVLYTLAGAVLGALLALLAFLPLVTMAHALRAALTGGN